MCVNFVLYFSKNVCCIFKRQFRWIGEMATCEIKKRSAMQPLRFKLTNTTDCNILSFFHSFGIPILILSRFNRIQQPHAHQLPLFVVKFNRQTCQMYMETRRYVYTYFILGQRIHCDENICQCEHTFRFIFIVPTRMGRTLPFDYQQWKFFIAIIFFIELYFFSRKKL